MAAQSTISKRLIKEELIKNIMKIGNRNYKKTRKADEEDEIKYKEKIEENEEAVMTENRRAQTVTGNLKVRNGIIRG